MDDSPFGKLPAEIRNQIYHLVTNDPDNGVIIDPAAKSGYIETDTPRVNAIAKTCRQMRSEAKGICDLNKTVRLLGPDSSSGYCLDESHSPSGPKQAFAEWEDLAWVFVKNQMQRPACTTRQVDITFGTFEFRGYRNQQLAQLGRCTAAFAKYFEGMKIEFTISLQGFVPKGRSFLDGRFCRFAHSMSQVTLPLSRLQHCKEVIRKTMKAERYRMRDAYTSGALGFEKYSQFLCILHHYEMALNEIVTWASYV